MGSNHLCSEVMKWYSSKQYSKSPASKYAANCPEAQGFR